METLLDIQNIINAIHATQTPEAAGQVLVEALTPISEGVGLRIGSMTLIAAERPLADRQRHWLQPEQWQQLQQNMLSDEALVAPLYFGGRVRGALVQQAAPADQTSGVMLATIFTMHLSTLHEATIAQRVQHLSKLLMRQMSTDTLLQQAVTQLVNIFGYPAVMILKFGPDDDRAEVLAEHPTRNAVGRSLGYDNYQQFVAEFGADLQAFQHVLGRDAAIPKAMRVALRAGGFQTYAAMPIVTDGQVIGAFLILNVAEVAINALEQTHLQTLVTTFGYRYLSLQHSRTRKTLLDSETLRQFVDSANIAIDIIDRDGIVVYHNPHFEHFFQPMTIGTHFRERLLPDEHDLYDEILFGATRSSGWAGYVRLQVRDEMTFEAHIFAKALRDRQDRIIGYSIITDDVSDLRSAVASLRHQTDRLTAIAAVSHAMIAQKDMRALLEAVLGRLCLQFRYHSAQVLLVRNDTEFAMCLMACDVDGRAVGRLIDEQISLMHDDVIHHAIMSNQLVINDSSVEDALRSSVYARDGLAECVLPLGAPEQTPHVLVVQGLPGSGFTEDDVETLQSTADQLAIAIDNTYLFQQQQRRMMEMQTINNIGLALAGSLSTDNIWRVLVEEVGDLFSDAVLSVAEYDVVYDLLVTPELHLADQVLPPVPEALSRAVIHNGISLRFDDLHHDGDRLQKLGIDPDNYQNGLLRSWLGAPLYDRNKRAIGVLCLQSDQSYAFTDRDTALLSTLVAQAALALENRQLLDSEQQRRKVANSLIEMGRIVTATLNIDDVFERVLEQMSRVIPYDAALILLPHVNEQTTAVMRIQAQSGFDDSVTGAIIRLSEDRPLGHIYITKQPIVIDDVRDATNWQLHPLFFQHFETRAWLGVPLLVQSQVIGLLAIAHHQAKTYSEETAATVFALARQAAIAMENARLHNRSERALIALERRNKRLASLSQMATIVSSTLSTDDIFRQTAQLLTELFQVDHVGIVMFRQDDGIGYLIAEYPETGNSGKAVIKPHTAPYELTQQMIQDRALRIITEANMDQLIGTDNPARSVYDKLHIRTTLLAPMQAAGSVIGTIGLDSYDAEKIFSPNERETFMTIVTQVGMAIRNAQLYEEAVAANHIKNEFLGNVSHELRTPLNAIIGYSELLLNGNYGTLHDKQHDRLARVYRNGRNLLAIIDDILDLSKIEAGRLTIEKQHIQIVDLVRDTLDDFSEEITKKGLTLTANIADDLPKLEIDGKRIRQVLVNLLSNAVKFTDVGEIELAIDTLMVHDGMTDLFPRNIRPKPGQWLRTMIRDTGIGIAPENQAIIFDAFRQVDGSAVREYPGTGLGLAITHRLVTMHEGHLWVESAVGEGSLFTFLLPIREQVSSQADPRLNSEHPLLLAFSEDEMVLLRLEAFLETAPYQVLSSLDAAEVIELAKATAPTLLILSVSAAENAVLLAELNADERIRRLPVVIISDGDPAAMAGLPMNYVHLATSYNRDDLLMVINEQLG